VDIYLQEYTIYDNPFLPLEYVHNLEAEYRGTVWYDRYILGLWTLAEGLIYPHFSKALEDTFLGPAEEYVISLDYGTSNPFAALLWAKRGSTWHVVNEYYYSGRVEGIQKTDGEYLEELEQFASPAIAAQQRVQRRSVFGMLGEPERIPVIVDPSAASFITLLRQSKTLRPRSANNDVLNGIRNTSSAIQNGLIKVSRTCTNWLEEAQSYVWDPDCEEDRPVKENDHLMDAMRYFVETMRIVRPVDNYRSPLER
jgi:PBSX family phage terminase large subunit